YRWATAVMRAHRSNELGVSLWIAQALKQQQLSQNGLIDADSLSLRNGHSYRQRIEKPLNETRVARNVRRGNHQRRQPVRCVQLPEQTRGKVKFQRLDESTIHALSEPALAQTLSDLLMNGFLDRC